MCIGRFGKGLPVLGERGSDIENEGASASAGADFGAGARGIARAPRARVINIVMAALVCVFSGILLWTTHATNECYAHSQSATEDYAAYETVADRLKEDSSYLTTQARMFAMTHSRRYLEDYLDNVGLISRDRQAADELGETLGTGEPYEDLHQALIYSDRLVKRELYVLKLAADALDVDLGEHEDVFDSVHISAHDEAKTRAAKLEYARATVLDEISERYHQTIKDDIAEGTAALLKEMQDTVQGNADTLDDLLLQQRVVIVLLMLVVIATILCNAWLLLVPIERHAARIRENRALDQTGARELRYLSDAYNVMYEENLRHNAHLRREAEIDQLTGVFNRNAYARLLEAHGEHMALIVIDVDHFKEVNDGFGHEVGDQVLRHVAQVIGEPFRSTDFVCRIGGDEFAVLMTGVSLEQRGVVEQRIVQMRKLLEEAETELPKVTLSIGVAFSDESRGGDSTFRNADRALYQVKTSGRNGYAFYSA